MSDETKEAEFGGWRKRRGQDIYEPKKGHPYIVRLVNDPDRGVGYGAFQAGGVGLPFSTIFLDEANGSEKRAVAGAKAACELEWRAGDWPAKAKKPKFTAAEKAAFATGIGVSERGVAVIDGGDLVPEQAAKLSVALEWTSDDTVWTAPGPDGMTYTVDVDHGDLYFPQLDGDEIAAPVKDPEAAKAICQWHRDTELEWHDASTEEIGPLWVAGEYSCGAGDNPADSNEWLPYHHEQQIGDKSSVELAQEACQEHHRLVHPLGAAELVPAVEPAPLGKPERELVTRRILCDLTPEEHAAAGVALAKARRAVGVARYEVALLISTHKDEKKRLEGIVEAKEQEADELQQPAETGQEYRELQVHESLGPEPGDGGPRDVILSDPETNKELDRRPASKSELQKWLPQVPEEAQTQQEAATDRILDMADLDSEAQAVAEASPEGEPSEPTEPTKLSWGKVPKELLWHTKGNQERQYRIDLQQSPGEVVITAGKVGDCWSNYAELRRYKLPAEGADPAAEVKRAKAWCQEGQIRWGKPVPSEHDGEPCIVGSRPCEGLPGYQLTRQELDEEGRDWHVERIGRLDEDNTDLLAHQGLEAAHAAAQADRDALQAAEGAGQ